MTYCKDADQLLGKQVVCGDPCPLLANCPRLILEDATDDAVRRAIHALMIIQGGNHEPTSAD